MACQTVFTNPCSSDFSCGVYGSTGSVGITGPTNVKFIQNNLVCDQSVIVLTPTSSVNQTNYLVQGATGGGGFFVKVIGGNVGSTFTFNYIGSNPC